MNAARQRAAEAEARRLIDAGYRQTSRAYRMLARLPTGLTGREALYQATMRQYRDAPNREFWEADTRRWVMGLGEAASADHYRRVYARGEESVTVSIPVFNAYLALMKAERHSG